MAKHYNSSVLSIGQLRKYFILILKIRYFASRNQTTYDPDTLKLYYGGVELNGNELLS